MKKDSKNVLQGRMREMPGIYFAVLVALPVGKGGGRGRFKIAEDKLNEVRGYIQEKMHSTGIITTDVFEATTDTDAYFNFYAFYPTINNSTEMKNSMVKHARVMNVELKILSNPKIITE